MQRTELSLSNICIYDESDYLYAHAHFITQKNG